MVRQTETAREKTRRAWARCFAALGRLKTLLESGA